ncbi:MAG: YtxH domain-containing protein [Bacteroidales bacterium]
MSSGKVFIGILAGVTAGAILGVLLAPDKGSATRKKMTKKGKEFSDDIKDKLDDFMESVSKKFEKVKEEMSDFTEKAKSKDEEVKQDAKAGKATKATKD